MGSRTLPRRILQGQGELVVTAGRPDPDPTSPALASKAKDGDSLGPLTRPLSTRVRSAAPEPAGDVVALPATVVGVDWPAELDPLKGFRW